MSSDTRGTTRVTLPDDEDTRDGDSVFFETLEVQPVSQPISYDTYSAAIHEAEREYGILCARSEEAH